MKQKNEVKDSIETVRNLVLTNKTEEFQNCFLEMIDKIQEESFMEGFRYAISILEDTLAGHKD